MMVVPRTQGAGVRKPSENRTSKDAIALQPALDD